MEVRSAFVKRRFGNTEALAVSDRVLLDAFRKAFPNYKNKLMRKKHGIIEA
jgi:hypothetical protein